MAQAYKVCPICGTRTHRNALVCPTCGTSLADVQAGSNRTRHAPEQTYDARYGETDLIEGEAPNRLGLLLLVGALILPAVLCLGIASVLGGRWLSDRLTPPTPTLAAQMAVPSPTLAILLTNTPRPTVLLPTVTLAPPSPTSTETPGPCRVTVQLGDSLTSLAMACGHRSRDVIPTIVALNELAGEGFIVVGDELEIPLPTATLGEAAFAPTEDTDGIVNVSAERAIDPNAPTTQPTPTLTATLPPGIMFHIVQPDESMVAIAFQYSTNAETLSQLNPEIPFSQCDFSSDTGGPRCTVTIRVGQQMRVPAPVPTPTLSPTLSGSETATLAPTPTYNAPSALSPNDRVLFERDELVTLRWTASGILNASDTYRVQLDDLTSGLTYRADTSALSFIVPTEWQSADNLRHDYEWTVSVITAADPATPRYTTPPRRFTWQGRG